MKKKSNKSMQKITCNPFLKSDSWKISRDYNFFVYKAILAYNSSKCSSLCALIARVKKLIIRIKNSISVVTIIDGSCTTCLNYMYK